MLNVLCVALCAAVALASTSCARTAPPEPKPPDSLEHLLRTAFTARNPRVTRAKVLELRPTGAGPYVLLGWGIRPDLTFEGSFDDELFGVFIVDEHLRRIERTLDIFPTCRWADCIVSVESVSWPAGVIVVVGAGSYGDQAFRKIYKAGGLR